MIRVQFHRVHQVQVMSIEQIFFDMNSNQVFKCELNFLFFAGGESFEGFGENDNNEQVSSGGIDLVLSTPHINSTPNNQ